MLDKTTFSDKKSKLTKGILDSPVRLVLTILVSILLIELVLSLLYEFLFNSHLIIFGFVDSIILVLLLMPILYFQIFRPMVKSLSEQRKVQAALQESEGKFRILTENSSDIIWHLDLDFRCTYISRADEQMRGFSQEEVIGTYLWSILKPEGIELLKGMNAQRIADEQKGVKTGNKLYEMEQICKDGSWIWTEATTSAIYDKSGKLSGYQGVTRNINNRKQAELEKLILNEILQGIATTSDLHELLALIHTSIGKMMYAENCYFALYDEVTGYYSFPYFIDKVDTTPEPEPMPTGCTAYIFRSGKPLMITPEVFQYLREQGEVELVGSPSPSWIGVPLQTPERTIGVLVLQHYEKENVYNENHLKFLDSIASQVANVIERKRAEEELKRSNSLLTATLESTADGILVVDKNGMISNYNKKFVELWRIPHSVISTQNDEKIISFVLNQLKDPEDFLRLVKELYQDYDKTSFDILEFNDGRIYERYSQPQRFDDKNVGRVWSFRDITLHSQAQEEIKKLNQDLEQKVLERTVQLQKAYNELELFSYSASHEIRTPLRAINGFANLLLDDNYDALDEEGKRKLQVIIDNAINMGHLIDDLLLFSGLSRQELSYSKINMHTMANTVFAKFVTAIGKEKFLIRLHNIPDAQGDPAMILQVWTNLIANAIKYSSQKQKSIIDVGSNAEDNSVIYYVKDNGIGFDSELSNNLFGLFKRMPNAKPFEGTGMGLAIVQKIIHQHNGRIWAEGEVGRGATFYFSLPQS